MNDAAIQGVRIQTVRSENSGSKYIKTVQRIISLTGIVFDKCMTSHAVKEKHIAETLSFYFSFIK